MNVAMILDMAAGGYGDRICIGPTDGGVSYERLAALAGGGAQGLGEPGGTLAVVAPTGLHTPVALFGAAAAGWSYAPLNYRLPPASLAELVERLGPDVLLADAERGEALGPPDAGGPVGGVSGGGASGGGAGTGWRDVGGWFETLRASTGGPFAPPDSPSAPAVVLYTSGTSSAPKAALLDHDHLLSYILTTVEFGSAEPDEAVLLAVPPFHIAGVAAVLTSCYIGRRIVPLAQFSADAWLRTAAAEQVTHAFVVPTMLARIVAAMEAEPALRVPSIRHLAYGGARMPLPVLERALDLFPEADFVNAYGLTETSSTVAVLSPDDHREARRGDPAARRRLQSVGQPLPGIEVQIAGDEGAGPLDAGQEGEVWLRGAQIGGSYQGTGSRLDPEGWLHTGDQGFVDEAGYLFVVGRLDDMIISGGENISPAEIEDQLLRHPSVAAVAVVGVSDPQWGERVGAMVVLREEAPVTEDDLVAWTRERL